MVEQASKESEALPSFFQKRPAAVAVFLFSCLMVGYMQLQDAEDAMVLEQETTVTGESNMKNLLRVSTPHESTAASGARPALPSVVTLSSSIAAAPTPTPATPTPATPTPATPTPATPPPATPPPATPPPTTPLPPTLAPTAQSKQKIIKAESNAALTTSSTNVFRMVKKMAKRVEKSRQYEADQHCNPSHICLYPQCKKEPRKCFDWFRGLSDKSFCPELFSATVQKRAVDPEHEKNCKAALRKAGFDWGTWEQCAGQQALDPEQSRTYCASEIADKCACGTGEECMPGEKDGTGKFIECRSPGDKKCDGKPSTWHGIFDKIVIINLKRRPERKRYMTEMLVGLGVPKEKIYFFEAIDVKQWGTVPFTNRLRKILHKEPSLLFRGGSDCCTRRLHDHTVSCDVSSCGLFASGLSHYCAIQEWSDIAQADPTQRSVLIMEDDACPTRWLFNKQTIEGLEHPPPGWDMIKLEDCYGMYRSYRDARGCRAEDGCNAWRLVRELRKLKHGAACVSAYALTARSARQFLGFDHFFPAVQKFEPWSYAIIEDAVNVVSYGPWANTSWQFIQNIFAQTEGLDSPVEGEDSDNHPKTLVLSNR